MKFLPGDATDTDLCIALHHEFLRCHDAFTEFRAYASRSVLIGENSWLSFKAYNAYSRFIHHLYEFMAGALMRERGDTAIAKGDEVAVEKKRFISCHAQRILTNTRDAIKNGTAPRWANALSAYPEKIPSKFADDFNDFRNKVAGHVNHERPTLSCWTSMTAITCIFTCCIAMRFPGGVSRGNKFPDLKEITDFTVLIKNKGADELS